MILHTIENFEGEQILLQLHTQTHTLQIKGSENDEKVTRMKCFIT